MFALMEGTRNSSCLFYLSELTRQDYFIQLNKNAGLAALHRQSQAAVMSEEEAVGDGFCLHWSLLVNIPTWTRGSLF